MGSEAITRNDLKNVINSLLPIFYPVGSYYETSDTTFDPNIEWGGTWVLETAGQVHVSSGTGYAINHANDNNGVGASDGGAPSVTLSANQSGNQAQSITAVSNLGNHTHPAADGYFLTVTAGANVAINGTKRAYTASNSSGIYYVYCGSASGIGEYSTTGNTNLSHGHTVNVAAKNATEAHTNMQPYINVNRWHRVA